MCSKGGAFASAGPLRGTCSPGQLDNAAREEPESRNPHPSMPRRSVPLELNVASIWFGSRISPWPSIPLQERFDLLGSFLLGEGTHGAALGGQVCYGGCPGRLPRQSFSPLFRVPAASFKLTDRSRATTTSSSEMQRENGTGSGVLRFIDWKML